ncbi:MAG: type II toxin-antitoxin system HicA family toxin [Pseudomonadota bacterium]
MSDIKIHQTFGLEFYRQAAGSRNIWCNPKTGRFTTIPNHPGVNT